MSFSTTETDNCTYCWKAPAGSLLRCSRCKLALYCNTSCQNAAWKSPASNPSILPHKRVCKPPRTDLPTSPPTDAVPGVRILGGYNRPFFPEATTVAPTHPIWTQGIISPISQIVDVPILIYRELGENSRDDNQSVTYLMINPESAFASPRWQHGIGPVTVVRADQKPLTMIALEMIWMYCDDIIEYGEDAPRRQRKYSPAAFQEFCKKYKEEYIMNGIRPAEFNAQPLPI